MVVVCRLLQHRAGIVQYVFQYREPIGTFRLLRRMPRSSSSSQVPSPTFLMATCTCLSTSTQRLTPSASSNKFPRRVLFSRLLSSIKTLPVLSKIMCGKLLPPTTLSITTSTSMKRFGRVGRLCSPSLWLRLRPRTIRLLSMSVGAIEAMLPISSLAANTVSYFASAYSFTCFVCCAGRDIVFQWLPGVQHTCLSVGRHMDRCTRTSSQTHTNQSYVFMHVFVYLYFVYFGTHETTHAISV